VIKLYVVTVAENVNTPAATVVPVYDMPIQPNAYSIGAAPPNITNYKPFKQEAVNNKNEMSTTSLYLISIYF